MRQRKGFQVAASGVPDRRYGQRRTPGDRVFSKREREVVELVAAGANDDEIARRIGICRRSVADTRQRAAVRLGIAGLDLRTDVLLTRHAIREGWVTLW